MSPAEKAWEAAKADIPRHDAQFSGVLYEPDGTMWRYNRVSGLWVCQCRHCKAEPNLVEQLSYADLIAEYTVQDWPPEARAA